MGFRNTDETGAPLHLILYYREFAELEENGWSSDAISSGYVELFASASDLAIPPIASVIKETGRVLDLCVVKRMSLTRS